MFHSLSESLLISLIIFVAFGWTITFLADNEFDLYVPLSINFFIFSGYARFDEFDSDPSWKDK